MKNGAIVGSQPVCKMALAQYKCFSWR